MTNEQVQDLIKQIKKRKEIILIERDSTKLGKNKLSPKDLMLEEFVLGSMIDSKPMICDLIDLVAVDFFIELKNQKIMAAITEIFGYSYSPDITTIAQELKKAGDLEFIGGLDYLNHLVNNNERLFNNN
jgi:replicative DNA helicase